MRTGEGKRETVVGWLDELGNLGSEYSKCRLAHPSHTRLVQFRYAPVVCRSLSIRSLWVRQWFIEPRFHTCHLGLN